MERRKERRLSWAGRRDEQAASALERAHSATEGIPFGQPILSGHHSEPRHRKALARSDSAMRDAVKSHDMAKHHREKAANLQTALDRSVFNDDPDACEALEARISEREAARSRLIEYNKSCRSAVKDGRRLGDLSLLDDKQKADLLNLAQVAAWQLGPGGAFPTYALTNLAGGIRRDRERLVQLRQAQGGNPR
ncbi:MAG TPA: DUF3560 domain-containing protein [Thermoanaerobaculia bacterium]|jgi:hypothetical protein|nr:DUF3560 domain-containing protein [Thermoanaerobaculia bacterium]